MPYTTLVAGTTITASWANASVRDQVVTPFASAAARTSAVTSPIEGMLSYRTDGNAFEGYDDGTTWTPLRWGPAAKVKTADETVNNSTTLQNDDDLFVSVLANTTYWFTSQLRYRAATAADLKIGWTYPASATMRYTAGGRGTAAPTVYELYSLIETDALAMEGAGASTSRDCVLQGVVTIAGTAGTFQLQWAQQTADASDTKVLAGSFLRLDRIS